MKLVTPLVNSQTPAPKMWHHDLTNERIWKREHVSPNDWLIPFPEVCVKELDEALEVLERQSLPLQNLSVKMFPNLTACRAFMAQVRTKLHHQSGMAIVDRVPVERYSTEQNKVIYWLLGQMLGRVVDQKWTGTTLYDVKDSGKALGHGVRRSITNLGQPFHTDGPWLSMTPEIVGLFCLQTAHSGGMSRLVSLVNAHHQMQLHHPDLLERLYHPFVWDRQAEHGPDDAPYSTHPVFESDGQQFAVRYYDDYIHKGYALAGDVLDAQGEEGRVGQKGVVTKSVTNQEIERNAGVE